MVPVIAHVHMLTLRCMIVEDDSIAAKVLSYNRANRAVAVLCNHQRAAPKNFSKQMENLQNKVHIVNPNHIVYIYIYM